jgi:hypothetical protein
MLNLRNRNMELIICYDILYHPRSVFELLTC